MDSPPTAASSPAPKRGSGRAPCCGFHDFRLNHPTNPSLFDYLGYNTPTRLKNDLYFAITDFIKDIGDRWRIRPAQSRCDVNSYCTEISKEFLDADGRGGRFWPLRLTMPGEGEDATEEKEKIPHWVTDEKDIRHAITHIFIQKQISASCTSYGRVTKERRRREKELSSLGPLGPATKHSPEPPVEEESKYDPSSPPPDHVVSSDIQANDSGNLKPAPESYQSIYPLVSLKSIQHIISLNPRGEKPVRAFTMEWLLTEGTMWPETADSRLERIMHDKSYYIDRDDGASTPHRVLRPLSNLRKGTEIEELSTQEAAKYDARARARVSSITAKLRSQSLLEGNPLVKCPQFEAEWKLRHNHWKQGSIHGTSISSYQGPYAAGPAPGLPILKSQPEENDVSMTNSRQDSPASVTSHFSVLSSIVVESDGTSPATDDREAVAIATRKRKSSTSAVNQDRGAQRPKLGYFPSQNPRQSQPADIGSAYHASLSSSALPTPTSATFQRSSPGPTPPVNPSTSPLAIRRSYGTNTGANTPTSNQISNVSDLVRTSLESLKTTFKTPGLPTRSPSFAQSQNMDPIYPYGRPPVRTLAPKNPVSTPANIDVTAAAAAIIKKEVFSPTPLPLPNPSSADVGDKEMVTFIKQVRERGNSRASAQPISNKPATPASTGQAIPFPGHKPNFNILHDPSAGTQSPSPSAGPPQQTGPRRSTTTFSEDNSFNDSMDSSETGLQLQFVASTNEIIDELWDFANLQSSTVEQFFHFFAEQAGMRVEDLTALKLREEFGIELTHKINRGDTKGWKRLKKRLVGDWKQAMEEGEGVADEDGEFIVLVRRA